MRTRAIWPIAMSHGPELYRLRVREGKSPRSSVASSLIGGLHPGADRGDVLGAEMNGHLVVTFSYSVWTK